MAKTADALDSDKFAWPGAAVTQCVEGSDARTHKGCSVFRGERVWNTSERHYRYGYVLSVAAVVADARNLQFHAGYEIAATARLAFSAVPAVPAYPDAVADFPWIRIGSERVDDPG